MSNFRKLAILSAVPLIIISCASGVKRGAVAMKIDDRTAHVALNKDEVKEGDHVELYSNRCNRVEKGEANKCTKVLKGHGDVTHILNESYSEVKFDQGVAFAEGDFIEIHKH